MDIIWANARDRAAQDETSSIFPPTFFFLSGNIINKRKKLKYQKKIFTLDHSRKVMHEVCDLNVHETNINTVHPTTFLPSCRQYP